MSDQDRRARLLWLALPLAAFVLLTGLAGHSPSSQALSPLAVDLTKSASPTRLLPGETTDYTVTLANSGQVTATLQVISDTLDPSLTFVQMLPGSDITATPSGERHLALLDRPIHSARRRRPGALLPGRYLDRARLALPVQ